MADEAREAEANVASPERRTGRGKGVALIAAGVLVIALVPAAAWLFRQAEISDERKIVAFTTGREDNTTTLGKGEYLVAVPFPEAKDVTTLVVHDDYFVRGPLPLRTPSSTASVDFAGRSYTPVAEFTSLRDGTNSNIEFTDPSRQTGSTLLVEPLYVSKPTVIAATWVAIGALVLGPVLILAGLVTLLRRR